MNEPALAMGEKVNRGGSDSVSVYEGGYGVVGVAIGGRERACVVGCGEFCNLGEASDREVLRLSVAMARAVI
ncbi:hypothetical protein Acr_28g0002590 [Actinidia rufa]|uniref:Uncharacterized protein n=1 Tax=Actinidia rufa TaxID=165716 RepID=A0A7J0H9Z7_9ERIC|nr:hypothetical protein Acr_28g0002590 [Actinidia rufa]